MLLALLAIVLGDVACSLGAAARASDDGILVQGTTSVRKLWRPPTEQTTLLGKFEKSSGCGESCKQMRGAYMLGRDQLEIAWSRHWSEELPCNRAKPEYVGFRDKLGFIAESPTIGLVPWRIPRSFTAHSLPIYFNCMVRSDTMLPGRIAFQRITVYGS